MFNQLATHNNSSRVASASCRLRVISIRTTSRQLLAFYQRTHTHRTDTARAINTQQTNGRISPTNNIFCGIRTGSLAVTATIGTCLLEHAHVSRSILRAVYPSPFFSVLLRTRSPYNLRTRPMYHCCTYAGFAPSASLDYLPPGHQLASTAYTVQ